MLLYSQGAAWLGVVGVSSHAQASTLAACSRSHVHISSYREQLQEASCLAGQERHKVHA